jgi:cell wall-associated NlpC family hydrolase
MPPLAAAGVVLLIALTSACASTGARPRPFPMPGAHRTTPEPPTTAPPASADLYAITGTALALRGAPYRNGGGDPSGFDCSGFTRYVFSQHGIALPRAVVEQFESGKPVKPEELEPGDLIFFSTVAAGPTHVAIALGGDEFVHAPSSQGVVRVERLSSSYWAQRFVGARRVVEVPGSGLRVPGSGSRF